MKPSFLLVKVAIVLGFILVVFSIFSSKILSKVDPRHSILNKESLEKRIEQSDITDNEQLSKICQLLIKSEKMYSSYNEIGIVTTVVGFFLILLGFIIALYERQKIIGNILKLNK